MDPCGGRDDAPAGFAEQWSRGAQWHYGWSTWRLPPAPYRGPAGRPPGAGAVDPARLDSAARRALVAYPGPVGELVSRELTAYLSFGHRFDGGSLIAGLVDQVLGTAPHGRPPVARPDGAG
jgi:hypothetical protein